VALGARVSFDVRNAWHEVESHNVVARIPGSVPARAARNSRVQCALGSFRLAPAAGGPKSQQVFHGARTMPQHGRAAGLAAAFKALPQPPARSMLFLATTSEEQGLLGARYYARHPVPLRDTVAT